MIQVEGNSSRIFRRAIVQAVYPGFESTGLCVLKYPDS